MIRTWVYIGRWNADIHDADRAGMVNSCADIEAEFRETERDGQRGADRSPQDGAGIGMDAGRDINRDDWFPGTVDEFDGFTIGSGYFR